MSSYFSIIIPLKIFSTTYQGTVRIQDWPAGENA
jgi:hypothetical protein